MTGSVSLGISIENRISKLEGRREWVGSSQDGRTCGCVSGAKYIACLSGLSLCERKPETLVQVGRQRVMESQTFPLSKGEKIDVFETGSYNLAQAGLQLGLFLP